MRDIIHKIRLLGKADQIDAYQNILETQLRERRETLNIAANVEQEVINVVLRRMTSYTKDAVWQIKPPINYPFLEKLSLDLTRPYYCPGPSTMDDKDHRSQCEHKSMIDWKVVRPLEGFEFDHWVLRADVKDHLLGALMIVATQIMNVEVSLKRFPHHATLLCYFSTYDFESDSEPGFQLSIAKRFSFMKSFLEKHPRKYELSKDEQAIWDSLDSNDLTRFADLEAAPLNKKIDTGRLTAVWKVMMLRFIHDYVDFDKYIDDIYGSNIVVRCRQCHQQSYPLHPRCGPENSDRYVKSFLDVVEIPKQSIPESNVVTASHVQSVIDTPLINSSSAPLPDSAPTMDLSADITTHTRVASGRAPYGWKYNGTRTLFIHDEDQQKNIELVKDLKLSKPNLTSSAISNQMNSRGLGARAVLDRNGQIVRHTKFNPTLIQSILADSQLV